MKTEKYKIFCITRKDGVLAYTIEHKPVTREEFVRQGGVISVPGGDYPFVIEDFQVVTEDAQ